MALPGPLTDVVRPLPVSLLSPLLVNLSTLAIPTLSLFVINRRSVPTSAPAPVTVLHFDAAGATYGTWVLDIAPPVTAPLVNWTEVTVPLSAYRTTSFLRLRAEPRAGSDLCIDDVAVYDLSTRNFNGSLTCPALQFVDGAISGSSFIQLLFVQPDGFNAALSYRLSLGTNAAAGNNIYDGRLLTAVPTSNSVQLFLDPVLVQLSLPLSASYAPIGTANPAIADQGWPVHYYMRLVSTANGQNATNCITYEFDAFSVIDFPYTVDFGSSGSANMRYWVNSLVASSSFALRLASANGAPAGHSSAGYFLALPSNANSIGKSAELVSPRFVSPDFGYLHLHFWLQNVALASLTSSATMLHVDVLSGDGRTRTNDIVPPISAKFAVWTYVSVSLEQFGNGMDFSVVFRVDSITAFSDVCIDDISVVVGHMDEPTTLAPATSAPENVVGAAMSFTTGSGYSLLVASLLSLLLLC
jgi:hypothetical protein